MNWILPSLFLIIGISAVQAYEDCGNTYYCNEGYCCGVDMNYCCVPFYTRWYFWVIVGAVALVKFICICCVVARRRRQREMMYQIMSQQQQQQRQQQTVIMPPQQTHVIPTCPPPYEAIQKEKNNGHRLAHTDAIAQPPPYPTNDDVQLISA